MKFLYGITLGIIYVLYFFGTNIECNSHPEYHINILNIHCHHWIIGIILLLIFELLKNDYTEYIRGLSIILIIHGLYYDDCFDFSVKSINKDKV